MNSKEIKTTIQQLVHDGKRLCLHFSYFRSSIIEYQSWYSTSFKLVNVFLTERLEEFKNYYNGEFTNNSKISYNIQRFLTGQIRKSLEKDVVCLYKQQIAILSSILDCVDKKVNDLRLDIQLDYNETQLSTAQSLLKINLRASGCIAGIVLEKYLKSILDRYMPNHGKKDKELTLAIINDTLKNAGIYDNITWRQIQYLADIRNICDHSKKDDGGNIIEPTEDKIISLIEGTNKIINILC